MQTDADPRPNRWTPDPDASDAPRGTTGDPESARTLATAMVLAVAITLGFLSCVLAQWVPAHAGVDQNGYLVGGKQLATTGSTALRPTVPGGDAFDPLGYVGRMWVVADPLGPGERYYPKYPAGYPLLVALGWSVGGTAGAYLVNPLASAAAVLGTFLIGRRVAGTLGGLLAQLAFATSVTTVLCATNPNSHATAAACATLGLYGLLRWLQSPTPGRGATAWAVVGGGLLGYAATVRYTEGLLVLPLLWVAASTVRRADRSTWCRAGLAVGAWALPLAALVAFNLLTVGGVTGYANTKESDDFRLEYLASNWEPALRQLSEGGLFLVFPLGVVGLATLWSRDRRVAGLLTLAAVPTVLAYGSYYWAPDPVAPGDVRYLRFFLSTLPVFAVGAASLLPRLWPGTNGSGRTVAVGAIVAVAIAVPLLLNWGRDRRQYPSGYSAVYLAHDLKAAIARPAGEWLTHPGSASAVLAFAAIVVAVAAAGGLVVAAPAAGRRGWMTFGAGVVVALAVAAQAQSSGEYGYEDYADRLAVEVATDAVLADVPAGSVVFCDERTLLQHLQFAGDFDLYGPEAFSAGYYERLAADHRTDDGSTPSADDPVRARAAVERLGGWNQKRLTDRARQTVADALASGRRVFLVTALTGRGYRKALASTGLFAGEPSRPMSDYVSTDAMRTRLAGAWNVSDYYPRPERDQPHSRRRWVDPWPRVSRDRAGGRVFEIMASAVPPSPSGRGEEGEGAALAPQ